MVANMTGHPFRITMLVSFNSLSLNLLFVSFQAFWTMHMPYAWLENNH